MILSSKVVCVQIAGGLSTVSPSNTGAGLEAGPGAGDKFQRSITEGDLEFLKFMSYDELTSRYENVQYVMKRLKIKLVQLVPQEGFI